MKRVCRVKGKIILITDNAGYIFFHIFIKNKNNYHGNYNKLTQYGEDFLSEDRHYALYSVEHLRNFFQISGIKVLSLEIFNEKGVTSRNSKLIHQAICFLFGKRFGCPCVKIVGEKI